MIARREFILALGAGALAVPLASFAQQPRSVRLGFLSSASLASYAPFVAALVAGLRDLGYIEGRNLTIEYRWAAGKNDRLPGLAAELVRDRVDVIVTHGTPGALAAKAATASIPVVFAIVGDAQASGIVKSLARPEGNVTGITYFLPELMAKRLELLREALPQVARVAVLTNPDNPASEPVLKAMQHRAESLKTVLLPSGARSQTELAGAFAEAGRSRAGAVVINDDAMLNSSGAAIADLAAKRRLPSIGLAELADEGGLMGYGVHRAELWRRVAYFVDKLAKGAKPADLPVEQPAKFEFVINMKTARALGVKIPQSILLRADRVIE
jgi:putative ABC transport system substrate-binding protein